MSAHDASRPTARRVSLALVIALLAGTAACTSAPTDPEHDRPTGTTAESMQPRLDGTDTTRATFCEHTQTWGC